LLTLGFPRRAPRSASGPVGSSLPPRSLIAGAHARAAGPDLETGTRRGMMSLFDYPDTEL